MELSQKNILITGGNSGIGLSLARQLSALGNSLIVVSRSQKNWSEFSRFRSAVVTMQCDLSKQQEVLSLVEKLESSNITLDILINSAAVQHTGRLTDGAFSFTDIGTEVDTNFTSIVRLCSLLLGGLLSRPRSAIVNLSSGLAFYPKTSSAVYCATKAALHSFSQSLRYQLAGTPVQVTEVILPLVSTPMTEGRGSGKMSPDAAAEAIIKGLKNGRTEIYVGKARLLPVMMRLWPGFVKRMLKKY
ncbi:MAG: SDR family NAD(P)-dependent oxidoreductase [Candidatus Thiodiazotropha sp. (ex Dulcina madagascariensis)]|nr:SDR family NAD(P)-dependent oxidoreductase [Candidatus Thiodiazotropha sp. (ex Dulcina madagascariensis)]MCU7925238.1 SDR family NAD(P)-dependent oxidoreductase [Candidatus Thiodiazotropha sp. (ex Dulcina madagascariensis)]